MTDNEGVCCIRTGWGWGFQVCLLFPEIRASFTLHIARGSWSWICFPLSHPTSRRRHLGEERSRSEGCMKSLCEFRLWPRTLFSHWHSEGQPECGSCSDETVPAGTHGCTRPGPGAPPATKAGYSATPDTLSATVQCALA